MSILSIIPGILRTIGSVLGIGKATEVATSLEQMTLTPDQRATLQAAMAEHELQLKQLSIDELKAVMSESLAEIQSSDKFTSRARPFGVYVACLITTGLAAAIIAGVHLDTGAVVTLIAPLWGQTAWYTYQRTREKLGSGNGK